jgi:transcription antitermination factor NusG
VYLPVQTEVRQWSDRKKTLEVPLFPNYIFVKITPSEWLKVLNVHGIVRFVCFEGQPAVIPDREIMLIKDLLSRNINLSAGDSAACQAAGISIGEKVRVTQGPFVGLEGTVIEQQGHKRLFIKLETIERAISVDVSACSLEKVG